MITAKDNQSPLRQPELESIVRAVIREEKGSFEKLHAALNQYVLTVAYKFCKTHPSAKELIKDISQEVWSKVNAHRATIQNPAQFRTWLHNTTRNTAINFAKKFGDRHDTSRIEADGKVRGADDIYRELTVPPRTTSYLATKGVDPQILSDAIQKLKPPHREVIMMAFFKGLPLHEIASNLGVPHGTVRSRLHYALHSMKKSVVISDT